MTTSARAGDSGGFAVRDWLLVAAAALMWGSSFLLIKLGVHGCFAPGTVAWLRLLFGAAALALVPAARKPLRHHRDRGRVALLGLTWMAVPFVLFPLAEQSIPSALAGMINGAAPLFTAAFAAVWSRRRPAGSVLAGLAVGFAGVLAVSLPAVGGGASLTGIGLVLLATMLYGVAFNLAEPLENRNGALPVIWRAQLAALALDTPAGVAGLVHSTPHLSGLVAMAGLGVLSTGAAFAAFTTLIARVGATRASVTIYLVPVVAIGLGASVSGEPIAPLSLAGIALVLLGAYLTGRRANRPLENPPAPGSARLDRPPVLLPASQQLTARMRPCDTNHPG